MEFCFLYIFPAADGLKKFISTVDRLNEIHTVIPDIHVLQVVVVERVLQIKTIAKILPTILERKIPT